MTPAVHPAPPWLTAVPYAHRGLHDPAAGRPENTLAAFAAGTDGGFGIELDVHLTVDGHVVVVHDHDLQRVAGTPVVVARSTLTELRRIPLLGSRDREPVPTLDEVLALVAGRVPVMVEIKNLQRVAGQLEGAVAALLDRYTGPVTIASFNPRTVQWFARHRPATVRGQTAGVLADAQLPGWLRWAMQRMIANPVTRPHYVSYELAGLPNPWVARWRRAGRPVITWTVRTPDELVKARAVADTFIFERVAVPPPAGTTTRDRAAR